MLQIQIDGGRSDFAPLETIQGTLHWTLDAAPDAIELRLPWYTEGRGDRDIGLVRTLRIEAPGAVGSHAFELEAPSGPYSFSARLISLRWAVEAVADPGSRSARKELVMAPDAREVELSQVARA